MAAMNGRDLKIKKDATLLAVVNSKTMKVNNTAVDVTNDDSSGFRVLLSKPGTKSMDLDISGYAEPAFAAVLRTIAFSGTDYQDSYTLEWLDPTGTVLCKSVGTFNLSDYEEKGESGGALEFSAKLASSGSFTYVVGP